MKCEHYLKGANISVQPQKQLFLNRKLPDIASKFFLLIEYLARQGLELVDTVRRGKTFFSYYSYVDVIMNS